MPTTSVVYLALGTRRIPAAIRQAAAAAGSGSTVLLVVPDVDVWRAAERVAGVTLRHVSGTGRHAARAARRLLLGPDGPAADADVTLVAGDAGALPVAWAVGRRRPRWRVVTEIGAASGRRPGPADLAVVTPWFPSPNDDFAGAFVRATTDVVAGEFTRVSLLHTEGWFYPAAEASRAVVDPVVERLAAVNGTVTVADTPQGELSRVTAPSSTPGDYPTWIEDHVRALRAALPTGRIEAPIVHAHTGMYAGVAATALARPDARLVVTEHTSFLPRVFRHAAARRRYAEMLERADVLLCVGPAMRDYLAGEFPAYAGKLRVVPNPIDFDDFAVRPAPPADLTRWLYVGRLIDLKRVRLLLETFANVAAADPAPTLTLVGSGPLEAPLRARAAELGLTDRVRLLPPVAPDRVAALMHEHDLLVHLSERETFGMTVVEAIATGTPVLVARSDGAQATMAGLQGRAGLLIDVDGDGDPAAVARAYAELRTTLPRLDLPGARAELLARYGREAVAAQLRHYYRSDLTMLDVPIAPAAVPEPPAHADRVLVIAIDRAGLDRLRPFLRRTVAEGRWVDLVTTADGPELAGVTVHRVRPAAGLDRVRAVEDLALRRVPGKGLDLLLGAARRRPGPGLEVAVRRAQRLHGRSVRAADRILVRPWWTPLRERALLAAIRDRVVPRLDLARTTSVVVSGELERRLGERIVTGSGLDVREAPDEGQTESAFVRDR
jgi:glycosyltransferase involved in cell wall biosynthesis